MNYINFFMYLMCNFKYFCKNYRFCIYTVMGNNKKKKKKKKNSKWPPFLGKGNFLKIAKSTFLRYPMGRKFQRNNSILHG